MKVRVMIVVWPREGSEGLKLCFLKCEGVFLFIEKE